MNRKIVVLQAVKSASKFLEKQFRVVRAGTKKSDGSLVSDADRGAERIIVSAIKKEFPFDGILSEESAEFKGTTGYRWIIDPLDGTHNFLSGLPAFGTLIALEYKDEIILGICVFPILKETFIAEKHKGAWLNGNSIHVSQETSFNGNIFLSDGNMRLAREKVMSDISKMADKGCRIRIMGSSAFSMTRVAFGDAIAATNRAAKPWDIAAPALLVKEAGGRVMDLDGKPWNIFSKSIIVTNSLIYTKAVKLFTAGKS